MMERPEQAGSALQDLGWSADRAAAFRPHAASGYIAGRVVCSGGSIVAMTTLGPTEVVLQRRWQRRSTSPLDLPAIGDWLALEPISAAPATAALREVLPRHGVFVRHRPFDGRAQVLAANLDVAFLVSGLDGDLNVRRIERYLVLALDGGVTPIVLLNKVDIALDVDRAVADVRAVVPGTQVIVSSATTGRGLDEMRAHIGAGTTACLLGSSGVGKSALANVLLGEHRQLVRAIREDDSKGRHTTTHRELFRLPGGGLLIDTPGLRTVGVSADASSLGSTFGDISTLSRECRFSDCTHTSDPGCAVRAAIEAGILSPERLASHHKLEAEFRSVTIRNDARARRAAERRLGRTYRSAGRLASQHKRGEA